MIRVAATGDIVLTRPASECAGDPGVRAVRRLLAGADIVLSSVELPFSDKGHPSDRILNFRAAPELAAELDAFSPGVVTLANNHSSDYGWAALADTRRRIEDRGIAVIGAGEDLADAEAPRILTAGGRRVGFLAWSCLLPLGAAAGPDRPGIAPIHVETSWEVNGEFQLEEPGVPPRIRTAVRAADLARALDAVSRLRAEADVVIVTLHWGYGFGTDQAEYQRVLGHALVDAGADAVLGHHVHAPQGVEVYGGSPIVYSPGNFVAQQPRDGAPPEILAIYDAFSPRAFVSLLDLHDDGRAELSLVPIVTNADGLPSLAGGEDRVRIGEELKVESRRRFGTRVEPAGDRLAVTAGP